VERDPIAVDQCIDLAPALTFLDCGSHHVQLRQEARVYRGALIELRTVVAQELAPHCGLGGINLLAPFPPLN